MSIQSCGQPQARQNQPLVKNFKVPGTIRGIQSGRYTARTQLEIIDLSP